MASQMIPDPNLIIAGFSAVMQAIQTWMTFRDRRLAQRALNETFESSLKDEALRQQAYELQSILPTNVLETLVSRTQDCFSQYNEVLTSEEEFLPTEIDNATKAVKRCVCRELNRLYELNGSIPPGQLEQWWNLYRCVDL